MGKLMYKDKTYSSTVENCTGLKYDNASSGLNAGNVQDAIDEVYQTQLKFLNLSNPNLFINGNFQIWQRGTAFKVIGYANQDVPLYTADRWIVQHRDESCNFIIEQTNTGLRIGGVSTQECSIYQILEEITYSAIKGKTLTLSYAYTKSTGDANNVYYEYVEESKTIIANDTNAFAFAYNNAIHLTPGIAGCVLHWVKLELGELATPFIPRLYGEELELCLRYYEKMYVAGDITDNTSMYTTGKINVEFVLKPKRIQPTIKFSDGVSFGYVNRYSVYANNIEEQGRVGMSNWMNNSYHIISDSGTSAGTIHAYIYADAEIYPEVGVG